MHKLPIFLLFLICLVHQAYSTPKRYSGRAITEDVQGQIDQILKTSYIINGKDVLKNIDFIQSKLQETYPGSWSVFITILQLWPYCDYTLANYSMNGEWWVKWYETNPYLPTWTYGLSRSEQKYSPQFAHYGSSNQLTNASGVWGKGIQDSKKDVIINILKVETADNAQKMLSQYVQPGNWSVFKSSPTDTTRQTKFKYYGKDDKYFVYGTDNRTSRWTGYIS